MRAVRVQFWLVALLGAAVLGSGAARAQGDGQPATDQAVRVPAVPAAVELPRQLTLEQALRIMRSSGLDLLIADAAVLSASGDVLTARAVANPSLAVSAGPTFNYNSTPAQPCSGCQPFVLNWSLADNGAVLDSLVGKRGLRIEVARAALTAARMSRVEAERQLAFQVKQQYLQVGLATRGLAFAKEIQSSLTQTYEITKLRYPKVIDEGALARVRIQKLEADQTVAVAENARRQAQVALGFLLGVREEVPDFAVEDEQLQFRVPPDLRAIDEPQLVQQALAARPDLLAQLAQQRQARAALRLAKRLQFPDVNLQAMYTQMGQGQNAGQPAGINFGFATNLPIFYQQQGEIGRAQADFATASLQQEKILTQIAADIGQAAAAYRTSRELVERMQGAMLERARRARDIVNLQYRAGAATLIDYLDAQRTYIATNQEYFQDLASYWTAVYQLEQAVGVELRK